MNKQILDVACGSRMFWHNKKHPLAIYMDNRKLEDTLCDGRKLVIAPDITGDFCNIPYEDNLFSLVVFDPPHLLHVGDNSWLAKKYGKLPINWQETISKGFSECFRVLKLYGILVFKWNTRDISIQTILALTQNKPLIGGTGKGANTYWIIFMKENNP